MRFRMATSALLALIAPRGRSSHWAERMCLAIGSPLQSLHVSAPSPESRPGRPGNGLKTIDFSPKPIARTGQASLASNGANVPTLRENLFNSLPTRGSFYLPRIHSTISGQEVHLAHIDNIEHGRTSQYGYSTSSCLIRRNMWIVRWLLQNQQFETMGTRCNTSRHRREKHRSRLSISYQGFSPAIVPHRSHP